MSISTESNYIKLRDATRPKVFNVPYGSDYAVELTLFCKFKCKAHLQKFVINSIGGKYVLYKRLDDFFKAEGLYTEDNKDLESLVNKQLVFLARTEHDTGRLYYNSECLEKVYLT